MNIFSLYVSDKWSAAQTLRSSARRFVLGRKKKGQSRPVDMMWHDVTHMEGGPGVLCDKNLSLA